MHKIYESQKIIIQSVEDEAAEQILIIYNLDEDHIKHFSKKTPSDLNEPKEFNNEADQQWRNHQRLNNQGGDQ